MRSAVEGKDAWNDDGKSTQRRRTAVARSKRVSDDADPRYEAAPVARGLERALHALCDVSAGQARGAKSEE